MAAIALTESLGIPEAVTTVLTAYLGYAVVNGIINITLLTHRDTRAWVSRPG